MLFGGIIRIGLSTEGEMPTNLTRLGGKLEPVNF